MVLGNSFFTLSVSRGTSECHSTHQTRRRFELRTRIDWIFCAKLAEHERNERSNRFGKRGSGSVAPPLLPSALDGGECWASPLGRLTAREWPSVSCWHKAWHSLFSCKFGTLLEPSNWIVWKLRHAGSVQRPAGHVQSRNVCSRHEIMGHVPVWLVME
jgi:hypothetical protein